MGLLSNIGSSFKKFGRSVANAFKGKNTEVIFENGLSGKQSPLTLRQSFNNLKSDLRTAWGDFKFQKSIHSETELDDISGLLDDVRKQDKYDNSVKTLEKQFKSQNPVDERQLLDDLYSEETGRNTLNKQIINQKPELSDIQELEVAYDEGKTLGERLRDEYIAQNKNFDPNGKPLTTKQIDKIIKKHSITNSTDLTKFVEGQELTTKAQKEAASAAEKAKKAAQEKLQKSAEEAKKTMPVATGQTKLAQNKSPGTPDGSTDSQFAKHAGAALAGLTAGVGITYALTRNRGQQSNAQLYGQQPLY
jgi:hypothetical protein